MTQIHGDTVRFGIHSGQLHGTFGACAELWRGAEELGYDWVSVFDHFRPHLYPPDWPCFEGTAMLAALAATTERIRCALLVSTATWRHPAVLANVAATVDHISGGRLEFGVGAGGPDRAHQQYGIPFPAAAERLDVLDEACTVLRGLWDEDVTTFKGEHFRLDGARLAPKPVQKRLPLVIGGDGARRTLGIVARHADIWNTLASSPETYRTKLQALAGHCAAAGRDPADIRGSLTFRAVLTESPSGGPERAAAQVDGAPEEIRREYLTFGTPEDCVADLLAYADLGVRDFLLAVKPPVDWRTVELVATRVAPAVRAAVRRRG
ncbi:LLM class flavin-dependent oxidoreductase [Actinocorallia sp. API 0066]|uniref:LLM class flavin-dependent oxidoreductase n=1 Tax=Actinocorallia sp. API 0066 TaxID=2896846 RepID=UPI001E5FBD87|nr:LLM class flavin-dependent oxidoreductase [Actinocorallia sp. API 0066]MCD0451625.1 LLM class flavin-dependent oxidoreductase [Actinocorallia sp. API 0066]